METVSNRFGFQQINLEGVYSGAEMSTLPLSDLDNHPNKKANRMIADKLLENIISHQSYFNIQFTKK